MKDLESFPAAMAAIKHRDIVTLLQISADAGLTLQSLLDITLGLGLQQDFDLPNGAILTDVETEGVTFQVIHDAMSSGARRVIGIYHRGVDVFPVLDTEIMAEIEGRLGSYWPDEIGSYA